MKMTVAYQFMYMLMIQAAASAVTFVFGVVAFYYFLAWPVLKEVVAAGLTIVNFAMLYIYAKKFAVRDYKPYTPLKPSKIKGALFGVFIAVVTAVLMGIFFLVWNLFGDKGGFEGVIRIVGNAVFYLWTFPYGGFMNLSEGTFSWYSGVIMMIVPVAATAIGYIAGSKQFELAEKLDVLIYEKDDEQN